MTPDTPGPAGEAPTGDDMGEPIVELRDLSLVVGDRFGRRVHGRIERRLLTGEFVGLAWAAPIMMLFEFLRVPFELFAGRRRS